jgi:uncharacterized protein
MGKSLPRILSLLSWRIFLVDLRSEIPSRHYIIILSTTNKVYIVPATRELVQQGIDLYLNRDDKNWSLTDCISFVVMQDQQLTEALTADRHFEQAGFVALLA